MAPPRKNTTQAPATALAVSKGKGKVVEVAEPANRHPNQFDVHITDAEDPQSSSTLSQRPHTAVLQSWHTNKQLYRMLFSLQKQMKEQQTELGRQAVLLKQVDILRNSQSSRNAEERGRAPMSPQRDREAT